MSKQSRINTILDFVIFCRRKKRKKKGKKNIKSKKKIIKMMVNVINKGL